MSAWLGSIPDALPAEFSITGWIEVGEREEDLHSTLLSCFDRGTRRGVTLSLLSGGGGYSAQGSAVRVSFGIDDGTPPAWEDCGTPDPESRYVSNSLTVFDGALFAATTDSRTEAGRAQVHRHLGGDRWESLGRPPGVDAHGIGPMLVHAAELFVAPWTYDWTVVQDLPLSFVHVYRLTPAGEWVDCGRPGRCRRITALASFGGRLYASGDDDSVHVYEGGQDWSVSKRLPANAHALHSYDGRLWAGTLDPGRLWSFDGQEWRDEGNPRADEDEASQLHSFVRMDGDLAVGSWPFGYVDLRDRATGRWRSLGAPDDATEINALQMYNGSLYAGSLPYAEVSRYRGAGRWETVRRLHAPAGWRAVGVGDSGWRSRQEMESGDENPAGDDAMREWGRATSMVEHEGRLFVSTGNCTSSYQDSGPETRLGAVHALSVGTVATSAGDLAVGRHHIAAVRAGRVLRLFIDGVLAATRSGDIEGEIRAGRSASRSSHGLSDAHWHDAALSGAEVARLARTAPEGGRR